MVTRRRVQRLAALAPSALVLALAAALLLAVHRGAARLDAAPPAGAKLLDPAAWGSDHVGQGVPAYMESGECLFCHRDQVGGTWQTNKHNRTIREPVADEPAMEALRDNASTRDLAGDVQLILGDTRAQKFLKRSAAYGHADLLTATAHFGRGRRARLEVENPPRWDEQTFATACAGCHATAVNPKTHAFATVSLDCFCCHGDGMEDHTDNARLMPLAKVRNDAPAVVISICASCHGRFGKSKSSGLPYPNNFVAGDNLFKDFQVDFARADDAALNPADRHVLENVREVVLYGRETMTCLTCHDVHTGSSKKHRELAAEKSCYTCHDRGEPIKGHKTYEVHSETCRY